MLLALLLAMSPRLAGAATLVDPAHRYRTLTTEHFLIHFHQGEERLAARLATIAEDVWTNVGAALGIRSPARTHVILADQSEAANGWATPLPYNTIFVTAAAPRGSEFIGNTDDWLRLVFTHEFTHVVHLDRSEGWARAVRRVFGRMPIAFPNLWLPGWQIEGVAVWEESRLTGAGRLSAGDFRAVEREAARVGRLEPLDRVNGGLTAWPSGLAPYAFGLGFHEYLANRYGEASFGQLAARTSRSVPFLGSRAFEAVYGRPLGALWRDYQKTLAPPSTASDRPAPSTQITHHGYTVLGPRFASPSCDNCPDEIVYSTRGPDHFPSLETIRVDGSNARRLTSRYLGSTVGTNRDLVVFDQHEMRRNVGLYSDLYLFDRRNGRVTRLTRDQRLQDPDLSPDGRSIVCVREGDGRRDLILVRLRANATSASDAVVVSGFSRTVGEIVTLISEADAQFNTPRWSPDGRSVAVERHRIGSDPEVVVIDVEGLATRAVLSQAGARIVTPAWRPDGRALVAAATFDGGPFDLYEFPVDGVAPLAAVRRLTQTAGGALWPDVSADGRTLVFAGYTASGFDLFVQPYPDSPVLAIADARSPGEPAVARSTEAASGTAQPSAVYSPWATLRPTAWAPILESGDGQLRAGLSTSGVDVLGRHAYRAWASWRIRTTDESWRPSTNATDWGLLYAYDRWRPTLFAATSTRTRLTADGPGADGRFTPATLRQHEVEAGVLLPVRHVRSQTRALLSVVRVVNRFALARGDATERRTATRVGLATNTSHLFGYSVSQERGLSAGATAELARPLFGSTENATTVTGDVRVYVPGFASHHVLALRLAGGSSTGRAAHRETFLLGGAGPNPSTLDFDREALSLMRGFPVRAFAGNHVALLNADYRFPLARPERGHGTWPGFLHTIHAAVFADAGHTWTDRFARRDLKVSAGGEISLDVVAGYSFPFTIAIGAARGHDGAERRDLTTVYARVGKAF